MGRRPPSGEFAGRWAPGYSDEGLRTKLARHAKAAGREVVEKVLWLYYASRRPDVPRWAKLTIYGALAYFIMPLDAIPDFTPLAGYGDDLGVLTAALLTVAYYVDDEVKAKARHRLVKWFGVAPGQQRED